MNLDILDQNYEVLISRYIEHNPENPESGEQQNYISAILMQFQLQDIKILDFFQTLQYYLTNGREQTRQNALNLVYQVFLKYHSLQVYESDFFPLLEFFLKKFYDVSLIQQSIQIVNLMLLRYQNLQKENGFKVQNKDDYYNNPKNDEKIFNQIFEQIQSEKLEISQYSRLIRLQIYKLLIFLTKNYPKFCLQAGENFIQHVIRHTEDEKDPRNIKPAFKILLFILEKFPQNQIDKHQETLFDNLECYYPIEINSQQNNKNQQNEINQEDLQNLLSICLCTKPLFKTTIGFLTEKIASENNYTLLCALQTFQYIFQKYTVEFFTYKELSNIQQNITIIAYDTNDQGLFTTHIEILSSFIFFLSEKVVHQEIFETQRLELIDRICQYFLQILIKEGISSDDTKKSLQILQNLSQTFLIANKISQPVFLDQMLENFEKEEDFSSKIQWLENLMYFLQGSFKLSQSQYYKTLQLQLPQNKIQELQTLLKKQFDSENESLQILSLKLFMILNEFPMKDQTNEDKILDKISENFQNQQQKTQKQNQLLDECYLDFCQFFQKIYQNNKKPHQQLQNLQKIFQKQLESYLNGSENLEFSEKTILFAFQGLLLPSPLAQEILALFFDQFTNNQFFAEKSEKIYQVLLKYLKSDLVLQNNKNINFLNIYTQIFQTQIQNKKIELQIETNRKYLTKIFYVLLEKILNKSQIQNQAPSLEIIEETKNYILNSLKSDQTKFNYVQVFAKVIKNSRSLFNSQFQQQIFLQIEEICKSELFEKNKHFFNQLALYYANQYQNFNLSQEILPCFKNLDVQDTSFKFFIGKLLISSPEALKQIEYLVHQIINPNQNDTEDSEDQKLNFFEEILKQINKQQKKSYLHISPLTSLNIFLLMISKGCLKTQQNLSLINQFYPQGKTEFYNHSTSQQQELQKTKSELNYQENQTKTLQMLKLITLSYTSLEIQQKNSSLITPLLLDLLKSSLNQKQEYYLVKVLYYWTQNDLNQFDGNHRSLIETVVHFFDKDIQDYNTLLYSLECLSNIIKVPYPLFCEFKKQILEILEKYKEHKKRPVRKYAVFIINSIHTME